jgi:tetratricopeptide (TPR) repeat protein
MSSHLSSRNLALGLLAAVMLAPSAFADLRNGVGRRAYDAGIAMIRRGNWVEATEPLSQAIAEDPHFAEAYLLRGVGMQVAKNYGAAGEDFTAYIVLNPNHPGGYMQRGVARLGQERFEEAQMDFRRGADLGAKPVNVQRGIGDAYYGAKKFREALAAYNEGVRLAPQSPTMYQRRARAYQALGDQRSAQADAAQSDALVRSGRALEPNDDTSELMAQAFAGTAGGPAPAPVPMPVPGNPGSGPIVVIPGQTPGRGRPDPRQEAADAAQAATATAQRGDLAAALRQMDFVVQRDPTVASYWTMRGAFAVQLGQADIASSSYEKALTLDNNDADAMLGLSVAYAQQRKPREARIQVERGLLIGRRSQIQGALVMAQGALSADLNSMPLREIMARLQEGLVAARR